jgi:hypothetical protein
MRRKIILGMIAAVAGPLFGVGLSAGPAFAYCNGAYKYTSPTLSSSTTFRATSACDGVWGVRAQVATDYVRGRFYKDGVWQLSSYGYQYITTSNDGNDKIIGNTTTGRSCKGNSYNYAQNVSYLY